MRRPTRFFSERSCFPPFSLFLPFPAFARDFSLPSWLLWLLLLLLADGSFASQSECEQSLRLERRLEYLATAVDRRGSSDWPSAADSRNFLRHAWHSRRPRLRMTRLTSVD